MLNFTDVEKEAAFVWPGDKAAVICSDWCISEAVARCAFNSSGLLQHNQASDLSNKLGLNSLKSVLSFPAGDKGRKY